MTGPGGSRAATEPAGADPSAAAGVGSIYDLGYQRYDGPRLGRPSAIRALFLYSLRGAFGIGRGGRAKLAPIGLLVLAVIPAIVAVGFQALIRGSGGPGGGPPVRSPIRYDTYYTYIQTLVMLFVAAGAPELLGRDQRHHVLSLYFSRALRRTDYALAKAGAFVVAILVLVLTPQAIVFIGLTLAGTDLVAAFEENVRSVPAVVLVGLAIALFLGAIGLVVSAFTPRRAYATATIIGILLLPQLAASLVTRTVSGSVGHLAALLSPVDVLDGLNAFAFARVPPNSTVARADLPGVAYLAVAAVATALLVGLLLRRYRRIPA